MPTVADPAPPASAAFATALNENLSSLRRRMVGLRAKYITVTLAQGALIVVGVAVAIIVGEMLLDWLVELPWVVRLIVFLGAAAVVAWLARKWLVAPWRARPGEDAMALMIERAMPIFRGRYIVSIQLARDVLAAAAHVPPALVRSLVAETTAMAADRRFGHVVKTEALRLVAKRVLIGALVLAAALFFAGGSGWILLKRAFLFNDPVPTKTRIIEVTGNKTVAVGDDLPIEATAAGFVPGKPGRLIITELAKNTHSEFPFEPVAGRPAHFARLVTSVEGPFDYQIRLGDGRTAIYHVTTRPRPGLAELTAEQIYPSYVHLPPVRRSLNDLSLLAGSTLRLRGRSGVVLKAASVRLSGPAQPAPIAMQMKDGHELAADVPIPATGVTGFSVALVDPDGIETRDPTVYRIDVLPDQPPTVKIVYPDRKEELVTTRARLLIAFEAADDFGVAKLQLHYKATRAAEGAKEATVTEQALEMNLENGEPREMRRRYEWKIADLKPPIATGTSIEYWLEATDNNTVSGPGKGASEHFVARVVTDQEKLADLMNRTADTLGGLTDATGHEEELNKQLGSIITDKTVGGGAP